MPTALVTGSGVRVGRAIASRLAEAGFDLLLHVHSSKDGAEEVARHASSLGRRAILLAADLSTLAGVRALAAAAAQQTSTLELLVHNAGLYEAVPFADLDEPTYRRMMAVNLEAPLFLTQALVPLLRAAKAASVVNITDAVTDRPYAKHVHYFLSKAGLQSLTRALAVELAPHIRVNGVAPGAVAFPERFDEKTRASILKGVPLGREGSPDDIARAVVFLAKEAPYVTGEILKVDGGAATA